MQTLVIGLDGATFHVLKPWIEAGHLPNLGSMIRKGVSGNLRSTIPPITPPAWTSFMTGKNPDKHGVYDFQKYDPGKNPPFLLANSTNIQSRTLWQILSENGLRVGVINVPMNYPPPPVNGFVISGFDAPSLESSFTYPEELRAELLHKFPDYSFVPEKGYDIDLLKTDYGFSKLLSGLKQVAQMRGETALYFMEHYPCDFFMVHFQTTDSLQHHLWEYVDPDIRDANPQRRQAVLEFYKELDGQIGRIFEASDRQFQDVARIILSDHGFSRCYGAVSPNKILAETGYLHFREEPSRKSQSLNIWGKLKGMGRKVCPPPVLSAYRKLKGTSSDNWARKRFLYPLKEFSQVDWLRTTAFVTPSIYGLLYFNRQNGNSELRERCAEELLEKLNQIRHPVSGASILKKVCRGSDIYSSQVNQPPDLVFIPQDGINILSNADSLFTEYHERIVGNHHENGLFIMEGPDIIEGQEIQGTEIIDLAPTILQIMGLPVPEDMDGRVLVDAFRAPQKIRYESAKEQTPDTTGEYISSAQDTEAVRKRLKDLGYFQ